VGASRRPAAGRQRLGDGVDDLDRARGPAGGDRVGDDHDVLPLPYVERLARVRQLDDPQPGVGVGDPARHVQPDGVVTAVGVPDADDSRPVAHRCSTVRSRKCVAHEMHGS
jgi:hypothetical protein